MIIFWGETLSLIIGSAAVYPFQKCLILAFLLILVKKKKRLLVEVRVNNN